MDFREGMSHTQRSKALLLRVQTGSPYAQTGYTAIWQGGAAQVWFWDSSHTAKGRREQLLPETLFHPALSAGLRLWKLDRGYEAQVWREGELQASRYWAQPPSAAEWHHFTRQVGAPEAEVVPQPQPEPAPWLTRPFARIAGNRLGKLREHGGQLWIATFLLLGVLGLWQGEQYLKYQHAQQSLQGSVQQLRSQGQILLTARTRAEHKLAEVRAIQQRLAQPSPLLIMNALLRVMPAGVTIQSYQQQSKLIIVKFSKRNLLNVAQIVSRIQVLPFVALVSPADARRGQLELHIRLQ